MTRWNWNWEEPSAEDRSATRPQEEPSAQDGGSNPPPVEEGRPSAAAPRPAPDRRQVIRRRRAAGLGLGLLAALLAIVLIASAGSGASRTRNHGPKAHGHNGAAGGGSHRPSSAESAAATAAAQEAAINHVLSYTPAVVEGGHHGNEVALTFDDGPGPYTQALVATLDRLHVHATFFAIGEMERYFSAGTVAELHSGDAVEDHTETHPMLTSLSPREQHEQLFEQIVRVEVLGVPRPLLWRPPYGAFNATTFAAARRLHLLMVLWSADTGDYTLPGVHAIVERALAGAHPGAIILMHDGGGNRSETTAALPAIVAGLRKRGLQPVTVPQLLVDDPPPPGRPLPTNLSGD